MRLLDKPLDRIPSEHLEGLLRFPMRVDLRDYASWIAGKNPYAADPNAVRPNDAQNSLESFLAFQISHVSGGHTFSVADLTLFAKASHILIVLDGFDEVADIPTREQIVREITKASNRLAARSLQVLVTSRPAAFAKSPGFPHRDWTYLSLQSMESSQINEYAENWMRARYLLPQERSELLKVLGQKLDQPHMRDLARNPMQLAILLSLIQTRGLSLPDKRTALYDSYMELFFNREGEKSAIVREHRDLLITLHQYLAWIIQTEAEEINSKGSITEEKLKLVLREYLAKQGHRPSLVDDLFVGMIERVVALVSRVQGTFEFEVQPLREYFAARYLYETAPYSPPGREKRGTNPERFEVLSRNFYWLNVTRFFCGCYSRGELSSLADGLIELAESDNYRETSYPRLLTLMLLGDWVFAQQPLTIERLVKMLLDESGLKILLSGLQRDDSTALIAPERCGRSEILEGCKTILANSPKYDVLAAIAFALQAALPNSELQRIWSSLRIAMSPTDWLRTGRILGLLPTLDIPSVETLLSDFGRPAVLELAMANCFETLEANQATFSATIDFVLRGNGHLLHTRSPPTENPSFVSIFGFSLDIGNFQSIFRDFPGTQRALERGLSLKEALTYRNPLNPMLFKGSAYLRDRVDGEFLERCEALLKIFLKVSDRDIRNWKSSLEPWSELVDSGVGLFGRRTVFFDIALVAAGIISKTESGQIGEGLLDNSVPLCQRIRYARLRSGSPSWWETQFAQAGEDDDLLYFVLTVFLVWATPRTVLALAASISPRLEMLSESHWEVLSSRLERSNFVDKFIPEQSIKSALAGCDLRIAVALGMRLPDEMATQIATTKLAEYQGDDRRILRFGLERGATLVLENPTRWSSYLPRLRHAYSRGLNAPYSLFAHGHAQVQIPLPTARKICSNAAEYPLNLIEAAQAQLTKHIGSKAKAPGMVAKSERWFS
ncbi:hypothetical protein XI06_36680 [Bradyrhizobium sp. CCBAU 11434]|uniref:NACHT domain-containing protein n=1 Tax=Bradyrhizobium sp. CCBAU 11434 TaxID=1630885 RepID=UPI002306A98C|nr:NACHT domain-containing protein [Bradyrhizobium sp. CCBAU 11434]MDA9525711.1 hypothetical protein [Bradyrhizobium sp. CCBAU 11434]